MTWNYRIIKHTNEHGTWFALHEVYYNDDGSIDFWDGHEEIIGDSREDIIDSIQEMLNDAQKIEEVLDEAALQAHVNSPEAQEKSQMRRALEDIKKGRLHPIEKLWEAWDDDSDE